MIIRPEENNAGLVVGNSTFAADVSPKGRLFRRIKFNPPSFESEKNAIRLCGDSCFRFSAEGVTKQDTDLDWNVTEHTYPIYTANARLTESVTVYVEAYSPIGITDDSYIFIPAIIAHIKFVNNSDNNIECAAEWEWECSEEIFGGGNIEFNTVSEKSFYAQKSHAYISVLNADRGSIVPEENSSPVLKGSARVVAGGERELTFRLSAYFAEQRIALTYPDAKSLIEAMDNNTETYRREIREFINAVPNIGDKKILEYTRWYMQAAIMLTKGTSSGEVITMGYTEFNQRDSYWTSFVHLVLWSGLERNMIAVSCKYQREDGKIPTTVLPLIEREYDIDINEYFCLRIARYYKFHNDLEFVKKCWASYKKAVNWLLSRDMDGDSIPEQDIPENKDNYWADWKDVIGVRGRRLAPHFALLWLAVLKEGAAIAKLLGDGITEKQYAELYNTAYEKINRDFDKGGMWLEDHYTEIWYDGRKIPQVLQDQTAGLMFDVVPEERRKAVYTALTRGENAIGIPETYPYRENFGDDKPCLYHNGGIWPYLTFCDVMSRFYNGYSDDAERIIKKVGYYDLEAPGDYSPNEYLHGQSGKNLGCEVQGWSSALYGALTQGAFGIKHISADTVKIEIRFPNRDFETELVLPKGYGLVKLTRQRGKVTLTELGGKDKNKKIICD